MIIDNKKLTEKEEEFVNYVLEEFKKYSDTVRFDNRSEILGIGEPNRHLFCYFKIENNELYYKFKEQKSFPYKEGLDLSKEVKDTIDLFGKTNFYLDINPLIKSTNKKESEKS